MPRNVVDDEDKTVIKFISSFFPSDLFLCHNYFIQILMAHNWAPPRNSKKISLGRGRYYLWWSGRKNGDQILRYPFLILAVFAMSVTKPKTTADDLEAEAEKAFQCASAQQNRKEDDFDFEFESSFQSPPSFTNLPTINSSSSVTKDATGSPDLSNGPSQLPVKTEGLPSSLPSSQG